MPAPCRSHTQVFVGRCDGVRGRRAALVALAAVGLLPGCSSLNWLKTRFVEPAAAQAPVASTAAQVAPTTVPQAAPQSAPQAAPQAAIRAATPAAEAPAAPAPVVPPARPIAPPASAALPAASPPAAAPAAVPAASPPKAAGDLAPGRWAVQVAVFMTPAFAETRRSRLVEQLLANSMTEADATRVVTRDDRYFVLVGDLADRAQAEALAARLRSALRQDVVVFRR